MTEAQQQLRKFKNTLGSFGNPRPRDVDTPETLNRHIDKVVSALDAIRPQRVEVEVTTAEDPQETLDLTTEEEEKTERKKKGGPDRRHKGGQDRSQG
jgi:hypothetical protein